MGIPDYLTCFLRNLYAGQEATVGIRHGTMTDSKLGKECMSRLYIAYFHLAHLTYMQSTSCEMLGWIKHKLESRLPEEIAIISDMQMTHPSGRKLRGTKDHLDEGQR